MVATYLGLFMSGLDRDRKSGAPLEERRIR
jgi:hypothetical protein